MYVTTEDGVDLYYETDGGGECVAFVGDCGFGAWQWAGQYDGLAGPYRTLTWDLRGTGRSDAPDGPYDVDRLAADLDTVLADSGARRAHIVGTGLGGMVALRYAREYGRAASLALFGTAPRGADVDIEALRTLHPGEGATRAQFRDASEGAFSPAFRDSAAFEQVLDWRVDEDHAEGLAAQVAAVEEFDAGPLYELTTPALVFHGIENPVVDADVGRTLADDLPHGEFVAVEGRHLAHVEHARAVTDRLAGFLDQHESE